MKTAKRTITGVTATLATLAMLAAGGTRAGDLNPPGAPGATMHTLEEIYQELLTTRQRVTALESRLDAAGMDTIPAEMVLIPSGAFVMGNATNVLPSGEGFVDEKPQHTVMISAFYMDATEVAKAKWDEVYDWAVGNGYSFDNTGSGKDKNHPVHTVNWYDCVKWANARSEMEGLAACYTASGEVARAGTGVPVCDFSADGYRLPTEAEWEKAARGGAANRRFPWSDTSTIQHMRANYYASTSDSYDTSPTTGYHPDYNSGGYGYPYTSPVASFASNGYGLYDMAGNLTEWCWDWYGLNYYASSPGTDPSGPVSGSYRMLRGGSWDNEAYSCRIADRSYYPPGNGNNILGFRLVRAAATVK